MALLIAEIGQNFCGKLDLAKQLIFLAKENGADLCKFQLYDHNKLYANHPEIPNVELSKEQAFELFNYGKEIGIEVFFSVFDVERVKWCEEMGVTYYKIGTLRKDEKVIMAIHQTMKPAFCSFDTMVPPLRYYSNWKYLYCVPNYPAKIKRLQKIQFTEYDGFSDHTIGLDAAKIALARGAQIIEKHFCLSHDMGVDAPWSMTPDELRELKRFETIVKEIL